MSEESDRLEQEERERKAQEARARQAHNEAINRRVKNFQKTHDAEMAKHKANAKKLERLKNAKKSLSKQQEQFSKFKSKHSSTTPTSSFKGNRRTKYNTRLTELSTEVSNESKKHQENMNKLNRKITELEVSQSTIGNAIAEISATIKGLWSALW